MKNETSFILGIALGMVFILVMLWDQGMLDRPKQTEYKIVQPDKPVYNQSQYVIDLTK